MSSNTPIPRRSFLATSAALAGALSVGAQPAEPPAVPAPTLAVNGGTPAVTPVPAGKRALGAPERERLEEMLGQDTLFYWKGPQTTKMIERFKEFTPLEHVMPCSSGTAALHIAVMAAGIAPGDEVITSPVTDVGSVIGVIYQQAVPVFADLGANTYNLDPTDVERRITPKTKAIIAVHLTGNPCDMEALRAIADKHNLVLIEDCAQAWGAKYRGKPIGTLGHAACWSLQNSKHITCGDGGIVASNDPKIGPLLQRFGDKGFDRELGKFLAFSTNYRMSEPQAAVVAGQLTRLEEIAARRAHLGTTLAQRLGGIPGIQPHEIHPEDRATCWFTFFRIQPEAFKCDRAEFVKALSAEGVQCGAGYIPTTVHKSDAFLNHAFFAGRWPIKELGMTDMDYAKHETPEAEKILQTAVRMTLHENMPDAYIEQCSEAVRKVARHFSA